MRKKAFIAGLLPIGLFLPCESCYSLHSELGAAILKPVTMGIVFAQKYVPNIHDLIIQKFCISSKFHSKIKQLGHNPTMLNLWGNKKNSSNLLECKVAEKNMTEG